MQATVRPIARVNDAEETSVPVIRWLNNNFEKYLILISYIVMATIIFEEVIRRYLFKEQAAWSTTIPVYLFLWVTWFGAAYNVRTRSHLRFTELRQKLPYKLQFGALCLDFVLWVGFGGIVIYYTVEQVQLQYMNFAIVPGTTNIMQWWFYLATPFAWSLLIVRALQNLIDDWRVFRSGEPFDLAMAAVSE